MKLPDLANKKNQVLIVNIVTLLIALFFAINIYKAQVANIKSLGERRAAEMRKNEIMGNISQSEKAINSYKNLLAKKDVSLVVNKISDIARQAGVRIVSIKPNAPEDYQLYTKHSFSLAAGSGSYHTIGKFINNLENSPDMYFVDKINIKVIEKPRELGRAEAGPEETDRLSINLTISTIVFKGR